MQKASSKPQVQQQRQQHHHRQQHVKVQAGSSCDAIVSGRCSASALARDEAGAQGGKDGGSAEGSASEATRWAVDCQLTVQGLECDAVGVQCKGG